MTAHKVSTNRGKIRLDDIRYALRTRNRSKQLGRFDRVQVMSKVIDEAKKVDKISNFIFEKTGGGASGKTVGAAGKKATKSKPKGKKAAAKDSPAPS